VTQFESSFSPIFPKAASSRLVPASNLWNKILPIRGKWTELYSEDLTADQRKKIIDSLNKAAGESGFHAEKVWGR